MFFMSKSSGSFFSKLIGIIVVVVFIIIFRDLIITDKTVYTAFSGLLNALPFSKIIISNICRIMKYNYSLPESPTAGIGTDIMKLLIMACIQPLFVSVLSMIFLKIPSKLGSDEAISFVKRPSYKIKEILITIITAPILALIAAWVTTSVFDYFTNNFNAIIATVLKVLSAIIVGTLSLTPLLLAGTAVGIAVLWRLFVTIGAKVLETFVTNVLCLWIYLAIINGIPVQVYSSIMTLVIWLLVMDFFVKFLQRTIVGIGVK